MQINELRPFSKRVEVTGKIINKNEVREVTSKLDDSQHKVTEAVLADNTASVLLTLWDDTIDNVEVGKVYKVANGYTSLFQRKIRLNI